MKTGRSSDSKAVKASSKCTLKTGQDGVKNSPKRKSKWDHKARGYGEELLTDKENQCFPFKNHVKMCPGLLNKDAFLTEKKETDLHPGQTLTSSAKIKLQLFPLSEGTRIGLEKDGHHPYLELTLNGRKKISSVLKHLEKKWGSSSITKGEPMLFPYNITENLSDCRRWTKLDSDTTAATVYAAVGSPAIFRLKYGWFDKHEPGSFGIPSPTPHETGVNLRGTKGGCNANLQTSSDEMDKVEVTSKECKASDEGTSAIEIVTQKMDNAPADPLDNDPKLSSSLQHSSFPWADSLSNISIGGLLSEASLLGALNSKSFGSNAASQPGPIVSDSLDAFIAAQISHPPVSRLSAEDLRTSILDAEETCHAFPLRKLSCPAADVETANGKNHFVACSQDASSNSLKLPNTDKVNDQDKVSENPPSEKRPTDLSLSSRLYDDERSLGLTGINWNDSMGPFDLGMPAKKLIGGDNVSIGEFVK